MDKFMHTIYTYVHVYIYSSSVPSAGYFAGFVSAGFEPRNYPVNTPQTNPARVTYSAKTDVSAMRSARGISPRNFMFDMAFLYLTEPSRCRHYKNSGLLSSSAALSMIQKQFCSHTLEQRQQRGRVSVSLSE